MANSILSGETFTYNNFFMRFISMFEFDDIDNTFLLISKMSCVVIVFLDGLHLWLKFTNVDTSGL